MEKTWEGKQKDKEQEIMYEDMSLRWEGALLDYVFIDIKV